MEVNCDFCQKIFNGRKERVLNNKNNYCSVECYSKHKEKYSYEVNCVTCKRLFKLVNSRKKKSKKLLLFARMLSWREKDL